MNTQGTQMSPYDTAEARTGGTVPHRPRPQGPKNRPAGAAMVLGVTGLGTSVFFFGGLLGLVGLVLGIIALVRSGPTRSGRGKAITGVVTSAVAIVVAVLVAFFMAWYANETQECYRPDSFQQYEQCVRQQLTGN
ncbi:DUF4190 domain-containing protein [Streptomyces sp. H34-S4]|uniref:DUF4190 domain-containing protein n=1 Tax=Streptomyces sp. H34-S4 TaxID=2996463 RepID=UPI00226F0652|nr:DUF4190 domain-containing protein [Streptomyces sp. H34-S4]MCY0937744.1 DUF4190 domain-containing protein [Streptomyces sp. H34-S4]